MKSPLITNMGKNEIEGKIIFLRGCADVPLDKKKDAYDITRIRDTTKVDALLSTLDFLVENDAKIVLQPGWLGRPEGIQKELSTITIFLYIKKHLQEKNLLKHEMIMAPSDLGGEIRSISQNFDIVEERISKLQDGQVLVLENPRFDPEYNKGDQEYAKKMASFVDYYVAEDFAHRHRPASDIIHTPKNLPTFMGTQLFKEVESLENVIRILDNKKRKPFSLILAGKKIETKPGITSKMTVALNLLDRMIPHDKILVGGAVAYTFLVAKSLDLDELNEDKIKGIVGESYLKWDNIDEQVRLAKDVLNKAKENGIEIVLPEDHVIRNNETKEFKTNQKKIPLGWQGVDIGSETVQKFNSILDESGLIVMAGPVGMFDKPDVTAISNNSQEIVRKMGELTKKGVITISAGGESTFLVNNIGTSVTHASIGGGATLEFIEKGTLEGLEVLNKPNMKIQA